MSFPKRRVAVIGGGLSGLFSVKCLKEEGIEPVCFEKAPFCGGTWHYHDDDIEGMPSVMWTTVINHSKEMGAFSDFPPPKNYPNYMSHQQLYSYVTMVCEKFDLFRHINYNHEVISVKPTDDYTATGRWTVTVRNNQTGETSSDTFDGVMVCVGQFTHPNIPKFPGLETFKGKVMHTHSLKKVHEFTDKRVLVIGIGCSALDAAVETSNVAKQVYISTRNGAWIFPRVGPYGIPVDYVLLRRYAFSLLSSFPISVMSLFIENTLLNQKFNHRLYNLNPKYHVFCKDPAVNDLLPCKLITGAVIIKKGVKTFTENGVVFEGENKITELDAIILATGYNWKFPFLSEDIITKGEKGRINLYKCMYPPHLPHPTLAIIGFILPIGPGFPLGEAQCRWAALLMNRKLSLPSQEEMMEDIKAKHKENVKRFSPSDKMSLRMDYIPYLDDITSQFGAKPNLLKMAFTDLKLFRACFFGPCLPYQYRLEGPHSWPGAREAILKADQRMRAPLSDVHKKKQKNVAEFLIKYSLIVFLLSVFISWKEQLLKPILALIFLPYLMSWRGILSKYFFILLVIPFFVTGKDFMLHYFSIVFIPFLISLISSF